MPDIRISDLPLALTIQPDDVTVIVQSGVTKRSSVAAFASSAIAAQTFLTTASEPTLANARRIVAGSGIAFTDGGSGSTFTASLTPSGVGAGTYNFATVTVDTFGRVTSANGNTPVTSVAATAPAEGFTISGSPITSTGTLTFTLANDLAAVEALSVTGLATRTAASTWTARTLVQPAAGITITNPAGLAGDPTFALANDLAAIEGLGTTGLATRTASDVWTTRTLTGTANEVTVANGDGVAGNPTVSLPVTLTFTGKTVTGGTFNQPTLTVRDNAFTVQDDADPTKQAVFQASAISTGTTRTYTLPNISDQLASLSDSTALAVALG